MATSTTVANFDGALKQIYRDSNLNKLTYRMRPLFGMLKKFEKFGGRNMPIPLIYGNPQGRSATFANAQTNRTQVLVEDFLLTRVNDYSVASITGEVIEATRGDTVAFLSALKAKIDGAMNALADAVESFLFRSGTGSLAQVLSSTQANPDVITLKQIEEIPNFEVGMTLVCSSTDGTSIDCVTPATHLIAGIDRSLGTITTSANGSGTDWIADTYLYVQGDIDAKISGLAAWLPSTAPGATAFFGVARNVDSRLSGVIHDGTADPLEETGIKAQSKIAREEGKPDTWLMHHAQVRRLTIELGSKKEYHEVNARDKKGVIPTIGYKSIVVMGDYGPIDVVACNKIPATTSFMLTKDSWTLNTLGKATKILMDDGLRILRQATSDGYEVRMGFRGNLSTNAPIWNGTISLPNP